MLVVAVERRRRSHIKEIIKELGSLLPNCDDTNCLLNVLRSEKDVNFPESLYSKFPQNNGSVIEASVEYIKQLQKDEERFGQLEERLRQNMFLYKKMLLRIQMLEAIMEIESLSRGNSREIATLVQPNTANDVTRSKDIRANATSARNQSAPVSSAAVENFDDVISDSPNDSFSSQPGGPNSLVL